MATLQRVIHIPADSEIGTALREAATAGGSLVVETGEATYTVDVEAIWQDQPEEPSHRPPTPEEIARSIEGIERTTGAWVGLVDAEAFKAYIKERRRTSSRPPVRL